ncbi:MAG TPA: MFS transporter [Candidatus Dormibacteraeota bacterium]|jgi:MFS family permease|nr:MFS transporter [Candidatus Dormibacteraeota bacterium]
MSVVHAVGHARTFDSLRKHRNYRLYFSGQVVSATGTWVQSVAQAWLVIQLTHSPVAVGLLAVCQFGPFALFGLLGGALTDRLDYRRTLLATQTAMMAAALVLGTLALTHVVQVWMVDAVAVFYGLVQVLDVPARQSFTVQMVGREELSNAVALNASLFNASRIVGPGLGGLIIATAGVGICFILNAASFLAVIGGLLLMRTAELHPVLRAERGATLFANVKEGLAYARRTPRARLVLTMMAVAATLGMNFNVLLPVLASHTLHSGPEVFGLLSACFGLGALAGALLSASLARALMPLLIAAAAGFGVFELLLAVQSSVVGAAILLGLVGVCFTLYTANSNSMLQLMVPDQLRGRVMSLYAYVFFGTAPLGGLLAGWLADRGGTRLAFLVAGGASVAAALYGAVKKREGRPGQGRAPLGSLVNFSFRRP